MRTVTVRELRNQGGAVLEEVIRGQNIIVTRDGIPVAELRKVRQPSPRPEELIRRRQSLASVDPRQLRKDIDELIDPTI